MSNQITVAGRIGQVKGIKPVGDSQVLNFSVGSDLGYGQNKKTLWVSCAVWGKRAASLADILTKGTPVTVFGSIVENRGYSTDNGPRADLSVRVNEITLQGKKGDGTDAIQEPMGPPSDLGEGFEPDETIPF